MGSSSLQWQWYINISRWYQVWLAFSECLINSSHESWPLLILFRCYSYLEYFLEEKQQQETRKIDHYIRENNAAATEDRLLFFGYILLYCCCSRAITNFGPEGISVDLCSRTASSGLSLHPLCLSVVTIYECLSHWREYEFIAGK